MHDLNIVYPDRPHGAMEVTAAGDPEMISFGRNVPPGRWQESSLAGGWGVNVVPASRVKDLRTQLPPLLRELESRGISSYHAERTPGVPGERDFRRLGVVHAFQGGTDYPGSIYLMPELPVERSGGYVPSTGDPLAKWLGEFLNAPERNDVRQKLSDSGAVETHAFVLVPGLVADAPFAVLDLVITDAAPPPTVAPDLPNEITDVWAASPGSTGTIFRWAPESGWATFAKPGDVPRPGS
jgi:hypothetical protein